MRRAMQSQLAQNIVTNYLAVVWLGALSLGLIPVYLARLGANEWGVVALCISIQAFFTLIDAGLAQIMPRDVARVAGDRVGEAKVYAVFARAYLGLGALGFALGQLSVSWIVEYWIKQGEASTASTVWALRLVLVQFLFQFANNANLGFWNGVQAQKMANIRQCVFATLKNAGALALVYTSRPDALGYLAPFALVSFIEWWTNRRSVLAQLGRTSPALSRADFQLLARETGELALGLLMGSLASQMDRVILSRAVDLASFGRYVIVANLGLAAMQLQYPLMRAYFPRMARETRDQSGSTARQLALAVFIMCVLPCALLGLLAPWILAIWIRDAQTVREGTMPLRLILVAVALNALYNLIYQHILLRGQGRFVVLINLSGVVLVAPLLAYAAPRWGILAGGLGWVLLAGVQLSFGTFWLRNILLRREHLS
jgi:O-antigen/teichoic acid export membrane protein